MIALVKALVVLLVTAFVGWIASFVYGIAAHFFDLFIIFPFFVAGAIVGVGSTLARWLKLQQGLLLLLIGLVVGAVAYPVYLSGKYMMLVAEFIQVSPAQLANFDFSFDTFELLRETTWEEFVSASERTDDALRQQVGQGGIVGQALLNMQMGIPFQTRQIGEGNYLVGGLVELFKFGVLVLASGSALRDTVKAEALFRFGGRRRTTPRRLSAHEEELWGKGE